MIFVLDAGNTHTVLGVFEEGTLRNEWRIRTDRRKTEDELGVLVKSLFDLKGISFSDINGLIISSVVPPLIEILEKMSMDYFVLNPFIIERKEVDPHFDLIYSSRRNVGADNIDI